MLYNIHTNKWDKQILKSLKIPSHILPIIKNSSDHFGMTHRSITGKSYPITGSSRGSTSSYNWTMLF